MSVHFIATHYSTHGGFEKPDVTRVPDFIEQVNSAAVHAHYTVALVAPHGGAAGDGVMKERLRWSLQIGMIAFVALGVCTSAGRAESVFVKYRGEVDLRSFDCKDLTRSSFINRVCYDRRNEYVLISLNGNY
jgi:hypothetical protein